MMWIIAIHNEGSGIDIHTLLVGLATNTASHTSPLLGHFHNVKGLWTVITAINLSHC